MATWSVCNPRTPRVAGTARAVVRIASLEGKVIGLLDNVKPNADHLLLQVGAMLKEQYGAAGILHLRKPTSTHGAPSGILDRLVRETDLVLTATGD